jgi:hypothetical protein
MMPKFPQTQVLEDYCMKLCSLVDTTVSEDRSECRRADRGSALQVKEGMTRVFWRNRGWQSEGKERAADSVPGTR